MLGPLFHQIFNVVISVSFHLLNSSVNHVDDRIKAFLSEALLDHPHFAALVKLAGGGTLVY